MPFFQIHVHQLNIQFQYQEIVADLAVEISGYAAACLFVYIDKNSFSRTLMDWPQNNFAALRVFDDVARDFRNAVAITVTSLL